MRVGQKFKLEFDPEKTYTAEGFFGATGIEYQTSDEAAEANGLIDTSKVCIKIKETGGACHVDMAVVVLD